jgi:hypothetical protein
MLRTLIAEPNPSSPNGSLLASLFFEELTGFFFSATLLAWLFVSFGYRKLFELRVSPLLMYYGSIIGREIVERARPFSITVDHVVTNS